MQFFELSCRTQKENDIFVVKDVRLKEFCNKKKIYIIDNFVLKNKDKNNLKSFIRYNEATHNSHIFVRPKNVYPLFG